jgi:hypothetical protein
MQLSVRSGLSIFSKKTMRKNLIYLVFILGMTSNLALAESCVKVRDACITFSKDERHAAEKQGLSLGLPYLKVRSRLLRHGWIEKNDEAGARLTCGVGVDAMCSAEFSQAKKVLFLTFSKTNNGMPLTSVDFSSD